MAESNANGATNVMDELESGKVPRDRYKIVLWGVGMLGISSSLPLNIMFINAYAYFSYKFNGTDVSFSDSFEGYFNFTYAIPSVFVAAVTVWLQTKLSIPTRFYVSSIVTLILLIITAGFVKVPTSNWVRGFFPITLFMLFTLGVFAAVNSITITGLGGVLGGSYMAALNSGFSVSGIISAVAAIISLSIGPITTGQCQFGNVETAALGYFSLAIVVLIISLVSFFIMMRMDFTKYHIRIGSTTSQVNKNLADSDDSSDDGNDESKELLQKIGGRKNVPENTWKKMAKDFLLIWPFAVAVFMTYFMTLSLYPTVVSDIKSVNFRSDRPVQHPWSDCLFVPLCFLVYNVADFVGRTLPQWVVWPRNRYAILILVVCRVVFYPLLLLCNHKSMPASVIVFKSDIFPIAFTSLLGITNGYLLNIGMILAPQAVDSKRVESASVIMGFFLIAGATFGATFSLAFLPIMGVNFVV